MAEPQKPIMRPPKNARNAEHKMMEKATTDATSRNGGAGSDNNSLMREISVRNNKQNEIYA